MGSSTRPHGVDKGIGRGTATRIAPRFEQRECVRGEHHDGWPETPREEASAPETSCRAEPARSLISWNRSPDIPFDRSINPYRGCEHGCIYCYARPSHAYVDLSPGIDFESRIFYKAEAAELLRRELARPGYRCAPIALGANTDPYQPVERRLRVTREILEVLCGTRHPVTVVTKGTGVLRDQDLLRDLAKDHLISVAVSLTTLDAGLKRSLEPRAASPQRRLAVIETLASQGIPVGAMIAPVIPALTDHELEALVGAAGEAGARWADFIVLRLPREVRPLFEEWLRTHYPDRAGHVMSRIRQLREGRANDARFGQRMHGSGPWSRLLAQRFRVAVRKAGLSSERGPPLNCQAFQPPAGHDGRQLRLF